MRLGAMVSGGKDSLYASYLAKRQGHELACVISVRSKNSASFMFHTPNAHLAEMQAEAISLPLVTQETAGEKEKELVDLKKVLSKAKSQFKLDGIVTGALFSQYQKDRIDKICVDLDLVSLAPLWHMDQEQELRTILKSGFRIIFTAVAAEGLDKSWLGRNITDKDVDRLVKIKERYGINIAGEGGEYESLVLECPLFQKKLEILESEVVEERKNTAVLKIIRAELQPL